MNFKDILSPPRIASRTHTSQWSPILTLSTTVPIMSADEDSKSISLSKAAARMRIKRAGETVEKRHQILQQQAAKRALAMEKESPEQRRQCLQKKAERAKVSRKNEPPEKRQQRLYKNSQQAKVYRENHPLRNSSSSSRRKPRGWP